MEVCFTRTLTWADPPGWGTHHLSLLSGFSQSAFLQQLQHKDYLSTGSEYSSFCVVTPLTFPSVSWPLSGIAQGQASVLGPMAEGEGESMAEYGDEQRLMQDGAGRGESTAQENLG